MLNQAEVAFIFCEHVTLLTVSFMDSLQFSLVQLLNHIWLLATTWTVACQIPLSMGFSRQEYWSGLPFSSPIDHYKKLQIIKCAYSLWRILPRLQSYLWFEGFAMTVRWKKEKKNPFLHLGGRVICIIFSFTSEK